MTDKQTEAMKLALEALEKSTDNFPANVQHRKAITALRRALEQQCVCGEPSTPGTHRTDGPCYAEQPAQQGPVATWVGETLEWTENPYKFKHGQKFYTTPQPPQRKPLTDEQIDLFINGRGDEGDDDYVEPTGDGFGLTDADLVRLVRRVEAAHGIKGGA